MVDVLRDRNLLAPFTAWLFLVVVRWNGYIVILLANGGIVWALFIPRKWLRHKTIVISFLYERDLVFVSSLGGKPIF